MSGKITIGLICGGTSGEHEVSLISAFNIQAALSREKYNVLLIGIDKNGGWFLGNDQSFLKNVEDVTDMERNPDQNQFHVQHAMDRDR
jgi:D-alanine-D-alanine ligase